jgi:RNA polymerase sigma-70 factor, ECF subfamily
VQAPLEKDFAVIRRITQGKEDAEDALQESLLKAFTHLNAFDGRSRFSTWLMRIAINTALMMVRKKRSHPESSFDDDVLPHLQRPDPALDPERQLLARERDFKLREAVRRLPPLLRDTIEIRYSQELSVIEVAAQTRALMAATKIPLVRARRSLLRWLSEHEGLYRRVSQPRAH